MIIKALENTKLTLFLIIIVLFSNTAVFAVNSTPLSYLTKVMDQFHDSLYVYTDSHAAGNHFVVRGRMSSIGDEDTVLPMNEGYTENPHSGINCIKAAFESKGYNWGGWYFMNGIFQSDSVAVQENWGDFPNAGVDLSGATELTFWAKGEKGGEKVEFFCAGIGRGAKTMPYPDSSPQVSTGYLILSSQWTQYTINLRDKDLHYVLGGFGWVTSALNNNNQNIVFYIDDIKYNKAKLDEPRFLVSYQTIPSTNDFDIVLRNVAYTYENAIALLAFLSSGDIRRSQLIADAFVYAQENDRFYKDGRIRNAYQGGDLIVPPGWTLNGRLGTVRIPGWYDQTNNRWMEDDSQVSTYTGNVSWVILALLAHYSSTGDEKYLSAAEKMCEWLNNNCRDERGKGGYTTGFQGFEPNPVKLTNKSTEHNIVLYAAFQRLYIITGDEAWHERATYAKQFVLSMWDETENKFLTGTGNDGKTPIKDVIPLDIQALALLAMTEEGTLYRKTLEYAEKHFKVGKGFDYNQDCDGVWYEGTAQMAVAYSCLGEITKMQSLIEYLEESKDISGGLPVANKDGLTTGLYLPDGSQWFYYCRLHVGTTGWMVLAKNGENPFWMNAIQPPSNVKVHYVNDNSHKIMLSWSLSPDDENITYYKVYRSRNSELTPPLSLDSFKTIDLFIEAEKKSTIHIASVNKGQNTFLDSLFLFNGITYYYWLQAVSETSYSQKISAGYVTNVNFEPSGFKVSAPYPNPFNSYTTIQYQIPNDCDEELIIYDSLGRKVAKIKDSKVSAGVHEIVWDGKNENGTPVGSGVYLYWFKADKYMRKGKMLLMK